MLNPRNKQVGSTILSAWLVPVLVWGVLVGVLFAWRSGVFEPPRTKVLLIGIDGMEWDIVNPLMEEGRLPNIKRLVDEGTSGVLLSREKTLSPIIWTTIATGKKREEHGIDGFFDPGRRGSNGERMPLTSADRKVPAIWNILGNLDRTVAVFGWWMTWPAEEVNGVMVSAFSAYDPKSAVRRGVHAGEQVERLTWPESLQNSIAPYMVSVDSVTHDDLARFVDVDDWSHRILNLEKVSDGVDYVLPWTYATDVSYVQVAERLLPADSYDLAMVYIQGTDTCCHRFWSFSEDSDVLHNTLVKYNLLPDEEETYRRYFGEAIERYYEFTDTLVGRLLDCIDNNTVVIVCSDHGFGPYVDQGTPRWSGHTFSGSHTVEGSIILWGPGIRQGRELGASSTPYIWDVAPTILAIMDLPLAQDMAGAPIMDALDARFLQEYSPEFVATYDVDYSAGERPEVVPVSAEYEERLRSLGYIQ